MFLKNYNFILLSRNVVVRKTSKKLFFPIESRYHEKIIDVLLKLICAYRRALSRLSCARSSGGKPPAPPNCEGLWVHLLPMGASPHTPVRWTYKYNMSSRYVFDLF